MVIIRNGSQRRQAFMGISFLPHRAPSRSGCRSNWAYAYMDASTSTAQSLDCGVAALRVHYYRPSPKLIAAMCYVQYLSSTSSCRRLAHVVSESCAEFHEGSRSRRREIYNEISYINWKFTQESIQINSMCSHANIPERLVIFFPFGEH